MEFAKDGKYNGLSGEGGYPTTIIATTKEGKMLFIVADGRQAGYSVGIPFTSYMNLAKELNFEDAFIVDGGGSATMVQLTESGYALTNRPSDLKDDGTRGNPRTVVNSVILSYGRERNEPDPTEEPVVTEAPDDNGGNVEPTAKPSKDKKGLDPTAIVIIIGAVLVVAIAVFTILTVVKNKKNSGKEE